MSAPPIAERHKMQFHRQAPVKELVRAATTANITISTALNNGDTLDGVTLATGDRVLVKNQSTDSQNGIYVVGATPVRDYDVSTDDPGFGYLVVVIQGTVNAGTMWLNTNTSAPTVGSTSITFSQFSSGMSNPMTTQDDIIIGGASGTPTRLAKGSDGQVLTVDPTTHHLVWATPSSGFSDPMTTRGDIIVRNASNVTARLAKGSADTFLHSDGTDVGYAAVTDAMLSTSDITTNNVSTSKHGFAPKGDGSTSKYLDASGAYSTPSGTGGAGNVTADSSVSVDLGATELLQRPTIANTEDDGFTAGSLDAKWLAYTGYDATTDLTALSSWCKLTAAGAKLQAIPAGDWTIELEVILATWTGSRFSDEGLILTSGTTRASASEMRWGIGGNNSFSSNRFVWEKFVNGAFSSTYASWTGVPVDHAFLKVVKSGSNYQAFWSSTGRTWNAIGGAQAAGFTVSHFGFAGENGTMLNYFVRY